MVMCDLSKKLGEGVTLNRRGFFKMPTAMAAAGLLVGSPCGGMAHADVLTREQRDKMTPDEILATMKRGSERFRKGEEPRRDFLAEQKASAKGQYPAAVLLSCIDSRAPAEVIMDLGLGNVFNCRVAGNVLNEDILGSMEFACKVAGAKVVLVMSHTSCGAIKGAIDNVELGNLTALLAKIRPAVKATKFDGERSSKNPAFVDAVARQNVELTMAQILKQSPVLRELQSKRALKVAGAMYNLETAAVEFFA
jgi:carbonic anhydrase